jgi:GNAT superfamily N-acetyltransferase
MNAQPSLLIPQLARQYVAWTERNVVQSCLELQISDLRRWDKLPSIPTGVEIRPLPDCGPEWLLSRIHNECSFDAPGYRPASFLHILALRSAPHHDPRGIFVARVNGRAVGFAMARYKLGGRGLVNGLAVRPGYRGTGVGRALLRTAILHLQGRGAPEAIIRVHPDNTPALQLYLSEGFELLTGAEVAPPCAPPPSNPPRTVIPPRVNFLPRPPRLVWVPI